MRNPWFEASAAIAAAGFPVAPPAQLRRTPTMDASWRYAFLRKPDDADTRPVAFPDIHALGRHIHQRRHGRTIDLEEREFTFADEDRPRAGVSVWIVADGAPTEYLGWAWLNGAGRDSLRAVLDQQQASRRARLRRSVRQHTGKAA